MITPKKALELTVDDTRQVKALEHRIDSKILSDFNGQAVSVSVPNSIRQKVISEIIEKYSPHWRVEYHLNPTDDQGFLTFSIKDQPRKSYKSSRSNSGYTGPYGSGGPGPYE